MADSSVENPTEVHPTAPCVETVTSEAIGERQKAAAATIGVGSPDARVATSSASNTKATVEGEASRMAETVARETEDIMAAQ